MLIRLLFIVAFLQVFSLQNCFSLLNEDQKNNIPCNKALAPSTPLKRPPEKGIFSPLTTPLQSPTKESTFSPLTILGRRVSFVRDKLALLITIHGSVSPESIGRVYEEEAPELLEKICDTSILDPNTSIERTSQGLNPDTYDGQPTDIHHIAKTPRRKILITRAMHQSKNRNIVTKKDLLSGEATIVAKRLTKQRAIEIKKESEAQALENGENVEFRRIGNALHPKTGPSKINRPAFRLEKRRILKDLSKELTSLQFGSS